MLRAEHVSLRAGARTLVRELDLDFQPGECWAVLGTNGAGKSTLLHTLAGLRRPDGGRVLLDAEPIEGRSRRAVARRVGVLLQEEPREYWGSLEEYVRLGRYPHTRSLFGLASADLEIARAAMSALDLEALATRAYLTLSGGERQRARLAALIAQQPAIFLLDEPLQHLDLAHQIALLELVSGQARQRGVLIVLVLHDLLLASRYCNRALLLQQEGNHAHGAAAQVLEPGLLGALYGYPVQAHRIGEETLLFPGRSGASPRV
jgi:iron complex transport system ATP-binding protein